VIINDVLDDALNFNLGNYSNSQLTIVRASGLNSQDIFSFAVMKDVTVSSNTLMSGGNVIANFTNYAGQLQIEFVNTGTIPTRALVDEVIQAVQYSNSSAMPPASVNLTYSFNDGTVNGSSSIAIANTTVNITASNTAPVVTMPSAQAIIENILNQTTGTLHFNGNISVADPYNSSSAVETITVTANHGSLAFSNIANLTNVTNNATIITATGTVAALNAALNGLAYTSNTGYVGTDAISVIINDNNVSGGLASSNNVNITISQVINQAPHNIVPASTVNVTENSSMYFNGNISISDTDSNAPETITLIANNGTLTFASTNGLTNIANNGASITATGTVAALNAALNGLVYTPNYNYFGGDVLRTYLFNVIKSSSCKTISI